LLKYTNGHTDGHDMHICDLNWHLLQIKYVIVIIQMQKIHMRWNDTCLLHSLDKPQLISRDVLQVLYSVCPTTKLICGIELSHHAVRGLPQSVQGQFCSTYSSLPYCGCVLALVSVVCPQKVQGTCKPQTTILVQNSILLKLM